MKRKMLALICALTMAVAAAGCGQQAADPAPAGDAPTEAGADGEDAAAPKEAAASGDTKKIYLITIDQMDQHWVNMDIGCKKAVEEIGNIDYTWLAPDVKDDAKQIESINNAVAGGADAILLAANGPDAVTSALKEADEAGVKIVQVDSFANYPCVQQLGTDNVTAGKIAGEQLLNALTEKGVTEGDIGVVSVNAATTSTVQREEGFRSAFEGTKFNILETQYGEGDAAKSKDIAANYITQGVVGIFGANEGSTVGVGNAIHEADGAVLGCGMDKSDAVIDLIKNGYLVCTMAQNPDQMGYGGIQAAVKALNGEEVTPEYVDTGVSILNKETVQ